MANKTDETATATRPEKGRVLPPVEEADKALKPQDLVPANGYNYILDTVSPERYTAVSEQEQEEARSKLKLLKKQITEKHNFYLKERGKNKKRAFIFRIISTALAAVVTVLLGLHFEGLEKIFNTIALIISGFITLIGIVQRLLDSKDLWVQYTSTAGKLEALMFTIQYLEESGSAIRLRDVEYVKFRYDAVMDNTLKFVINVRRDAGEE